MRCKEDVPQNCIGTREQPERNPVFWPRRIGPSFAAFGSQGLQRSADRGAGRVIDHHRLEHGRQKHLHPHGGDQPVPGIRRRAGGCGRAANRAFPAVHLHPDQRFARRRVLLFLCRGEAPEGTCWRRYSPTHPACPCSTWWMKSSAAPTTASA